MFGPLIVVIAYAAVYRLVVPEGINQRFLNIVLVVATAVLLSMFLLARLRRVRLSLTLADSRAVAAHRGDVLLLLFPLTPVVSYLVINREVISLAASTIVIVALAALAGLGVLLVPFLLRRLVPAPVTMMIGVGLSWVLYDMAALARDFAWHDVGQWAVQLSLAVVASVAALAIYLRSRTAAYVVSVLYFATSGVVFPLVGLGRTEPTAGDSMAAANEARLALVSEAEGARMTRTPDIFLLTFDSYVGQETMLEYGIDNSAQESYLEAQGFTIYPGTYSIASGSGVSMGPMLGGRTPGLGVAGDSPFLDLLRQAGYQTHGVFIHDLFFREHPPAYDRAFPEPLPGERWMLPAILKGQFDPIQVYPDYAEFLAAKRSALGEPASDPLFLYSHSYPSHSQNSGRCLPDETAQFAARLADANVEMQQDIETIRRVRPDAIIVVNGDHGPHLTKNCRWLWTDEYAPEEITRLDIQDRLGTFLAISWPEGMEDAGHGIETLQDVFPAILSELHPDLDYGALRLPAESNAAGSRSIAGVRVVDGIIVGGADDGEPLFLDAGTGAARSSP